MSSSGDSRSLTVFGCVLALAGGLAYLIYKTNELASLQETTFAKAWGPFIRYHLGSFHDLSHAWRGLSVDRLPSRCANECSLSERISKIEYAFFAVLALIDFARARISHAAASTFAPGIRRIDELRPSVF